MNAHPTTNRHPYRWLLLYLAALALLLWAPVGGLGIVLNEWTFGLRTDHLIHASIFIPCTFFWWTALRPNTLRPLLFALLCGVFFEGVQWFLPYRSFDINDMIANILGITFGWIVLRLYLRKKGAKRAMKKNS